MRGYLLAGDVVLTQALLDSANVVPEIAEGLEEWLRIGEEQIDIV